MKQRWLCALAAAIVLGLIPSAGLAWGQPEESLRLGGPAGLGQGTPDPKLVVTGQIVLTHDGQRAQLRVTATIEPGWYIYSVTQPPGGPVRTRIRLDPSDDYEVAGDWQADPAPVKKKSEAFDGLTVETQSGKVTWTAPVRLNPSVDPSRLTISGAVFAQRCDQDTCLPPRNFRFTAKVEPAAAEASAGPVRGGAHAPSSESARAEPVVPPSGPSPSASAFDPDQLKAHLQRERDETNLASQMLLGFLGGILLNFMPCVLPVIGLKLMSFLAQAGRSRIEALMLNVWYSLGLLSVWLLLGTLGVVFSLGLGEIFRYQGFNVVLAAVVFAMALSFLGVWEIPIPGFAGGGRAVAMAQREGLVGAFSKGILTTLLATPCVGPLMGSAVAWSVRQPPAVTYLVFASVGLGMASPYLAIGAFPKLIRFLPKPGAWMDTFKNVMGFVLLGTVVYLFTFLEATYLAPSFGLLVAVWAACWWIARTPLTAPIHARLCSWAEAAAFLGVAWIVLFPGIDEMIPGRYSFGGVHDVMKARFDRLIEQRVAARTGSGDRPPQAPSPESAAGAPQHGLPWQPFTTRADFERLLAAGNTVLVDFTADWCPTCKTLEALVLNTQDVRAAVQRHGVVTLQADWTYEAPEVTALLDLLGARQVPTLAIFPADRPNEPIVFRSGYTVQRVVEALEKAPSAKPAATVMR